MQPTEQTAAWPKVVPPAPRAPLRRAEEATIAQVALPTIVGGGSKRKVIAGGATLAAHGGLAVALLFAPVQESIAPVQKPAPMRVFEIEAAPPPEPPAPAPAPEPPPVVKPAAPAPRLAKAEPVVAKPAAQPIAEPAAPGPVAPAQAAQVVAHEAEPEMLDFTDFDIATGSGEAYVGGVTSAAGTNTVAVRGDAVAADGLVGVGSGTAASQARTVQLPGANWDCPWPSDARAIGQREESVLLRVVVEPNGRATSVEVLSDPGHGFGAAAKRCAQDARFEPALDASGRAIASTSPPIRVRFTR